MAENDPFAEAEAIYRGILARDPNHAEAMHALGMLAFRAGHRGDAEKLVRRAIALRPSSPDPHNTLGRILKRAGRLNDAITCYQRGIDLAGPRAESYHALGLALYEARRLDDALAALHSALAISPDNAAVHNDLGMTLGAMSRLDDAIACHERALALKPDFASCHSRLVQLLSCHPGYNAKALFDGADRWRQQHVAALEAITPTHANDRTPDRRLRIGYVSADFCTHTCVYFLEPLYRAHDRAAFEITTYAEVGEPDWMTERFQKLSDRWRSTVGVPDERLAEQIRGDEIDILVDLKLHTAYHRLQVFARRPAPVQVTWLGYPGTTGLRSIQYRLTDPYLDLPGGDESVHSEESIRLPDTFWCYDPLVTEPTVNALPALSNGHFTFGCFNNFWKINEPLLKIWASVMRGVERSRLNLLAPEGSPRDWVAGILKREGIARDRVEFISHQPRPYYLPLYHHVDIALDTLPYNGHTTSLDSFWMGVPVITLVGETSPGRAGMGQLTNLGLTYLIARTPNEFVRIAQKLAGDLPRLAELRATLRGRLERSPLMDAPRFARNIEAAYRQMWRRWCSP